MRRLWIVLSVVLAMVFAVACNSEADKSGNKNEGSIKEDYGDYEKLLKIDEENSEECKVRMKEYAQSLIDNDFEAWESVKSVNGMLPGISASGFKREKSEIKPLLESMLVGNVTYGGKEDIIGLRIAVDEAESFYFDGSDIKVEKLAYIPVKILDLYGEDINVNARMIYVDNEWYFLNFSGGFDVDEDSVKAKSEKYIKEKTSSDKVAKMFIESIENKDFAMFYAIYDKEMLYDELNDVRDLAEIYAGVVFGAEEIGDLVGKLTVTSKEEASDIGLEAYLWYEKEGFSVEEVCVYAYETTWNSEYMYNSDRLVFVVVKRNGEYMILTP